MRFLLLLIAPLLCLATSYSVNQNALWHTATDFTPNGTPGFGDTIANAQYTLTCETGQTCNLGTAGGSAGTIGDGTHAASFINNGTLSLRGQWALAGAYRDCVNAPSINLLTGSTTNLDENGGSSASGFVSAAGHDSCIPFTIGTLGDTCTWGPAVTCPTNVTSINNGSANGVLLLDSDSGQGDSRTRFYGVKIADCGSATAPCYQGEMNTANSSWAWKQVELESNGYFGSGQFEGVASGAIPITIDSTMVPTRLGVTDIYFNGLCSGGAYSGGVLVTPACSGARSISNSLLRSEAPTGAGNPNDDITVGMTVTNVVWDNIASYFVNLTGANIAGGSWNHVVVMCDGTTCDESGAALSAIEAPTASYVYWLTTHLGSSVIVQGYVPSTASWGTTINLDHFTFDNQSVNTLAHCFNVGSGSSGNAYGYSIDMSYFSILVSPTLGYQSCEGTAWSGACPLGPAFNLTHWLIPGGPDNGLSGGMYVCESGTATAVAPVITSYQANIFYDTAARIDPLRFGSLGNAANQPANVATPGGVDYNVNYNFLPFVTTAFTTACGPGCTNSGSPYAVPMTGSAPGGHDRNINPGLTNNTLNAYTWAIANGQAGTAAGFKQVFINSGPSAVGANIAALFYYINHGNIPARSLWNAMPDGTTIGPSQPVMFPGNIRTVTQ
jgi:hypothetical protein